MSDSEKAMTPHRRSVGISIRRALPRWAQISILLIVFASGGVVGAIVASKVIHSKLETYRTNAPVFASDISSRLRARLELTDQQAIKLREILVRRHQRMIESRQEGFQAMHAEFDQTVEEISGLLNQQQLKRWQLVSETVRRRFLPPVVSAPSDDRSIPNQMDLE